MKRLFKQLLFAAAVCGNSYCSIGDAAQPEKKSNPLLAAAGTVLLSNAVNPSIYTAGICEGAYSSCVGYWKNGVWNSLSPTDGLSGYVAGKISFYDNDWYLPGYIVLKSGVKSPGYWKNRVWIALAPIDSSKEASCSRVIVSGKDVYAVGTARNSSGIYAAGYWKNGVWVSLPSSNPTKTSFTAALAFSGSDIYAGGFITDSSNLLLEGIWKNGVWVPYGRPASSSSGYINVSDLYVAGKDVYLLSGTGNGYWKNDVWTTVTAGNSQFIPGYSMAVSDNSVYISGTAYNSSYYYYSYSAGYWKNGRWNTLEFTYDSAAYTITVSGSDVYIGGYMKTYSSTYSTTYISGYWKNGIWNPLTAPDTKRYYVHSIFIR